MYVTNNDNNLIKISDKNKLINKIFLPQKNKINNEINNLSRKFFIL